MDSVNPGLDVTAYRLDLADKRAEVADARMGRIEAQLTQIQITLAGLATKDSVRNAGIAAVSVIVAAIIGVGAMLLQSSSNQLAAFQSGLSAIQAVSAARAIPTAKP